MHMFVKNRISAHGSRAAKEKKWISSSSSSSSRSGDVCLSVCRLAAGVLIEIESARLSTHSTPRCGSAATRAKKNGETGYKTEHQTIIHVCILHTAPPLPELEERQTQVAVETSPSRGRGVESLLKNRHSKWFASFLLFQVLNRNLKLSGINRTQRMRWMK